MLRDIFGLSSSGRLQRGRFTLYWLGLTLAIIVYFFLKRIEQSRVGRAWTAVREDEAAAELMGVPTFQFKLWAFAIGAGGGVELPFGGVKQTGNGHREAGETALDIFSEWKSVFVDFSGKLQKAQIDVD